ncbi:protein SCAI-like isoform X2 [Symsagittifera roscoffensis]|uniref:protein SCAI-like isoform X2 n=1 Tax=Symsagittifera roscoffensis TaxID=84072 RepID=UPI00307C4A0E
MFRPFCRSAAGHGGLDHGVKGASRWAHDSAANHTDDELGAQHETKKSHVLSSNEVAEILENFRENLEKSRYMFHALKDIPPHGHDAWKIQFGKTFEIHNLVWKMQQRHRSVLVEKGGLRRSEIGEIASKVGQLYYQYYIRTSDVSYLQESFNFYNALRLRNYFKDVEGEPTSYRMLKKLRFYTRYLVVILLLGRMQLVLEVMKEFFHFVAQFSSVYLEENQEEWAIVCSELQTFNQKVALVKIISSKTTKQGNPIHLDPVLRLSHEDVPNIEQQLPVKITIGTAVVVGNAMGQVKFNDLSIDMFRIVTCFELEKVEKIVDKSNSIGDAPAANKLVVEKSTLQNQKQARPHEQQDNPVKYLLYQPSISSLNNYLSSAFKELKDKQCLVVYISGEESGVHADMGGEISYGCGGVATNRRSESGSKSQSNLAAGPGIGLNNRRLHINDVNCLYPGDLFPYTRKPLFLIVESSNGLPFLQIPNWFGEPFMCIIAPQFMPQAVEDSMENAGGLLTLFLADPLMGLCKVCGLEDISEKQHSNCTVILKTFYLEAAKFCHKSKEIHFHILCFMSDQFLRMIILKYLFCSYVLRLHRSFKNWTQWPKSYPDFSIDLMDNLVLEKIVRDISVELEIQTLFNDSVRL